MGIAIGPRLAAFAAEPNLVIVGTVRSNGSVQMNPLWSELREGAFWLNSGPRRGWLAHIQRDERVTLLLLDPKGHHRWAQIQGRAVSFSTEGGPEHFERLALRYTGRAYRHPGQVRTIVRVEPLRVTGEDDGRAWDAEERRQGPQESDG